MLVRSGGYIGFLPVHYAEEWVRSGGLRALCPDTYRYTNTFYAITRTHRQTTRLMALFGEILRRHHTASAGPVTRAR